MTLSRQMRHKHRAARVAEPYRQEKIERLLRESMAKGTCVLIVGAMGAHGVVTELEVGRRVVVKSRSSTTNVPWKRVCDVIAPYPVTG